MDTEIGYLHHVGHVVRDIEQAREVYRKLGFFCPAPAYPVLERIAGEPATPFGAANMHATFMRNFVEIMTVVTAESHLPLDAHPILLQVPPAALAQVIESMERTIAKISASLARFEGLHILVFETEDANKSAQRYDQTGVGHSGVNKVQQTHQRVPMGVVEIDREEVPEGRLAVAENPVSGAPGTQTLLQHPNGAVDLVESMLCVPDAQIEAYVERYQRYLGRVARKDDAVRVFDLRESCVKLVPDSWLASTLPGETAPALPAFVAYAVAVRDLASTMSTHPKPQLLLPGLAFGESPIRQQKAGEKGMERTMSTIAVRGDMRRNRKVLGYWTTTAVVAAVLLFGGVMDLLHGPEVLVGQFFIQTMHHLGYPLYLLTILGCWKLLGAIALLVPRFPRLKEWAYAGTFFTLTGAAASYAMFGENVGTLILLILAVLTLTSWVLRPQSRTLGVLPFICTFV